MSVKKTITLPKIPPDASPEMQKFLSDLMKAIDELNSSVYSGMNNSSIQPKKAGATRDASPSKPDNPKVGTVYFEDDFGTGHAKCIGVCTAINKETGAATWLYAELKETL